MTGLALYFLQSTGWTLYDRRDCIDVESHAMPRKVVLCSGESTLFLAFSRNPNPNFHVGKNDHELPTDVTELESTNCRYSLLCEYPEAKESSGPHLRISWKCGVIMLGRMEEPDIGMLCPKSQPQELPVKWKDGYLEVCVLEIYRDKPVLGSDLWHDLSQS